jgi:hypothetical protein
MKKMKCFKALSAAVLVLSLFLAAVSASAEPWKFGVMSDTQWANAADAADNPGTVAVGIINQLNNEFISHNVKFVLQVGDLDDKETNYSSLPQSPRLGIATRAAAAQALYDAGIGFFPVRGNHEGSSTAALELQNYFPQTRTVATGGTEGMFIKTDSATFTLGTNFGSPFPTLNGLSYSFDYDNARFVLLDQFTRTDGTNYLGSSNNNIIDQQPWISSTLAARPANTHAFVISHKQLFGGNHADTLFNRAYLNPDAQNAFIASLDDNNVGYIFTGHDHMHNLSIVTSPDGASKLHQVICASDSYKFYTPVPLANHGTDTVGPNAGQISKNRETEISQELWSVGYYIVTVDGPRVTVDFYAADPNPATPGLEDMDLLATPALTFLKRETFGYSLNGKEVLVAQSGSYELTDDTGKAIANGENGYVGTTAAILNGTNLSTGADYNGRALTKAVNTGWAPRTEDNDTDCSSGDRRPRSFRKCHKDGDAEMPASDILTVWGMADLGSAQTDTYVLSMSFDHHRLLPFQFGKGLLGLAARDGNGDWVNAVDMNFGGTKKFVFGPWKSGYELGTYGIDLKTHTAWAVINYNADFSIAGFRHFR